MEICPTPVGGPWRNPGIKAAGIEILIVSAKDGGVGLGFGFGLALALALAEGGSRTKLAVGDGVGLHAARVNRMVAANAPDRGSRSVRTITIDGSAFKLPFRAR